MEKKRVLYIGGFQLPDKNAAAFRVMANAKVLRDIGYDVVFVNALTECESNRIKEVEYEGFKCLEYKRELQRKYLLSCKNIISIIKELEPQIVIAYNYPSIALNRLRKYCHSSKIKCYADATEWYVPTGNLIFRLIKGFDTEFRMRYVQPRMDGVIAISSYLYEYYKRKVKTVEIPPLVDLQEDKWNLGEKHSKKAHIGTRFIYAGSPSAQKERLDLIVNSIENSELPDLYIDIIGITKEQYDLMYGCKYVGDRATFYGRISNKEAIKMIENADWVVVLRDKNKVVQAGFPTKVPEAISCGTPIIANRFSNIDRFLNENNSILLDDVEEFPVSLTKIMDIKDKKIDRYIFDYRNFVEPLKNFMEG